MTQTETLTPFSGRKSGEPVVVDKGWLAELVERAAEAIAAVARGNNRAAGVRRERECLIEIVGTGATPAGCE